jgi:hypothetical protein
LTAVAPVAAVIMESLVHAGRMQMLFAACKLGLPELLAHGACGSAEIARQIGAHAPHLHRLMRGLVASGALLEHEDGRFALTDMGQELRADVPGSKRSIVLQWGEMIGPAMGALAHSAMTGEIAFEHVFGKSVWDYRAQHPAMEEAFHSAAATATAPLAMRLLETYDFTGVSRVVDVGGARGAIVGHLLRAHPAMTGVVFDRSVEGAAAALAELGVAERATVVAGDFFAAVPAGGDLYIMKAIIHDWNDEESVAILRNCYSAMAPGSRLLLIERLMPERAVVGDQTVLSDVLMMTLEHGRERTGDEFRRLLGAAGFSEVRVMANVIGPASLIEARR